VFVDVSRQVQEGDDNGDNPKEGSLVDLGVSKNKHEDGARERRMACY
jgi:hypothetical protein